MSEVKLSEGKSSEVVFKDQSIHEPTTAHQHPLETIPQGSQSDGVLNGHDHSDVNAGALAQAAVGMVALIVFSLVAMWLMMGWMLNTIGKGDTVPSHTFVERAPASVAWPIDPTDTPLQEPDEVPALMPDPETPMVELREQDQAKLKGFDYAKDDQNRTTTAKVTLPIERAMDLTIAKGLPADNLTQVQMGKSDAEPVAMGEIPYNKKVLKAEALKRGKQSPRFTPQNVGTATDASISGAPKSGSTTIKTAPMNKSPMDSKSGSAIAAKNPSTSVSTTKPTMPTTAVGQPNTRSKTGAAMDKKPNTQVGAMREGVN